MDYVGYQVFAIVVRVPKCCLSHVCVQIEGEVVLLFQVASFVRSLLFVGLRRGRTCSADNLTLRRGACSRIVPLTGLLWYEVL